ncbi:MAG: hypothetical protein EOP86_06735, partial [Verrucomicrobiaceae bacterium]
MTITPHQRSQIGILLGHAFLEIQLLIAQKRDKAASGLAYACHNLPNINPAHFEWDYFKRQFSYFHETHGRLLY